MASILSYYVVFGYSNENENKTKTIKEGKERTKSKLE